MWRILPDGEHREELIAYIQALHSHDCNQCLRDLRDTEIKGLGGEEERRTLFSPNSNSSLDVFSNEASISSDMRTIIACLGFE